MKFLPFLYGLCGLYVLLIQQINAQTTIIQPVSYTVVYKSDNTGLVSRDQLFQQTQVLNKAFGAGTVYGFNYRFELASIRYLKNDNIFDMCTLPSTIKQFRPKYMTNPANHLNVYICWCENMLGSAWLPYQQWFREPLSEDHYSLGTTIHWKLVAGNKNFSRLPDEISGISKLINAKMWYIGKTLVHEVGHHYGLKHPYEGDCLGTEDNSDYIADTPRMSGNPLKRCRTIKGLNSCPKLPGRDDLSNYMMMTDDNCKNHFTKGQYLFMIKTIIRYKPTLASGKAIPDCVSAVSTEDKSPDLCPCITGTIKKNSKGQLVCKTDPDNPNIWGYACCPSNATNWPKDICRLG